MRETLLETWLFNELTIEESAALLKSARVDKLPAGTVVTSKDKPNDSIRVLMNGEIELDIPGAHRLRAGDMFGEMSWLDGQTASATLRAATDLQLLVIPHAAFDRFLGTHPEAHIQVLRKLAVNLSHRLRAART